MAEISVGDIIARLRIDTADWQRGFQQATQQQADFAQRTQQTSQQLSQLPFNAIANAIDQFSRATASAGNSQQLLRQAIAQAQQQLAQFNVTIDASGRMTDRFGQVLSSGSTEAIRQFRTGIREAQAELAQFQRFGIDAARGGGLLQQMLGVAGGIGIATTLQGIVRAATELIGTSVRLSGTMADLRRSFVALEGSGAQATQTLRDLFQLSQTAGVGFQATAEGFRRFEAGAKGTTLTGQALKDAFDDITLGARAMGLSTGDVNNAMRAFEQMLTKGTLSAEEIVRQLGNAVPGGLEKMARGLGVTTAELRSMAEGGLIPATVGVVAFATEMRKLAEGAGPLTGYTAAFERLSNITGVWKTSLGNTLNDVLIPIMDTLTKILTIAGELANLQMTPEKFVPGWLRGILDLRGLFTARNAGETPQELQRMQGVQPGGAPIASSAYTAQIEAAGARYGVDPGLISQVARVESRFRPTAESEAGAIGLMQVMPATGRQMQPGITRDEMFEPGKNLDLGTRYLAQMLERFKNTEDQVKLALTAYHSGPGTVERLLGAAEQRGLPQTLEGISRIPASRGGLGPQGRAYAASVLEAPNDAQATQSAAALTRTTDQWKKELTEVNDQYDRLAERAKALAASTDDYNGILRNQVAQQLQGLVDRYVKIASYVATYPEQAKALGEGVRQEISERTQDAALLQQQILSEGQRRDLIQQQVEGIEQVISRQKAQLIAQREGQQQAELFTRRDAARLQEAKLDDRTARAGMTITQQIDRDTARLRALQDESAQLGATEEARRVTTMRPQLESELQRIQALIGQPGLSLAQQASDAVTTQFAAAHAKLTALIQETSRHPELQSLQEAFQNAFQALPESAQRHATMAFEAVERQARSALRGIEDQLDQISLRTGAAGLSPLKADLARISREAARTRDQLEDMLDTLATKRVGATAESVRTINVLEGRVRDLKAEQGPAETRNLQERQEREGRQVLTAMRNRLEQLQEGPTQQGFPVGESRETLRLRQAAATKELTTDQRVQVEGLRTQLLAQERLNYTIGLYEQFAGSVGQAWTNALMSIADHTRTVGEAFRDMAKSILQSIIQITSQEAWKSLIKVGAGLLTSVLGGLGGGMTNPAGVGGGLGLETTFGMQHGGIVHAPTMAMLGEGPSSTLPEYVLNRQQMQSVLSSTRGTDQGGGISIINVASKAQAEETAAQQRALGRQVVINEVLSDLRQGSGSQIGRMLKMSQT